MGPGNGAEWQVGSRRPLLAHKLVHNLRALLALDVATPVELAMAALCLHGLELVIAAATAHELAAVHALRGLVAEAALGAQGARGLVAQAVVGAGVHVHQVLRGGLVEAAVDELQLAFAGDAHGGSAVVLLLQLVPHLAELSQLEPAGLEAAGPRDAMAFASYVCHLIHSLGGGERSE